MDALATGLPMTPMTSLMSQKASLFSVGSEAHQAGRCKPCAFFHKQGCANGSSCIFCHQCPPHEKQRRKRLRRRMLREHFAPAHGQGSEVELHKHTEDSNWTYGPSFPPTSQPSNREHWHRGHGSWTSQKVPSGAERGAQPHQFAPQDAGMGMAACPSTIPSLLSTAPHAISPCRFGQDESPYSSPTNSMGYQPGPVHYALVQVPVHMQQLPHGQNPVPYEACPAWSMDPTSPCMYTEGYGDGSGMQWGNAPGTPYTCVTTPNGNVNGGAEQNMVQVSAF